MPRHLQESPPQPALENFEVPGLVPDDEQLYETEVPQPTQDKSDAVAEFKIPELVPDDEPVEARPLESSSAGVLGFNIPRPSAAPQKREQSTGYAYGGQRREQIEHFTELAQNAERKRREQAVEQGLAARALDTTVYPRPFVAAQERGDLPRK